MYDKIIKIFFIHLLLLASSIAQDIEFSGWGATGIKIYDRNILQGYSQEMFYEGKLQAEIEYNKNIEAQIDLRGNSIDNSLEFREFSVKFKYAEKLRWKIGNIKKPFGYEQSVSREDLISADRSYVYNSISTMGYGGRSVSVMAYYNYSDKREEFPYSYYLSIFKDNSLNSGVVARGIYHVDKYSYGISYLFQNKGGQNAISTHGMAADFLIKKKDYSTSLEVFLVQDPIEGQEAKGRNKINNTNETESFFAAGTKFLTSLEYKTDAEVITKIEPYIMGSFYVPNTELTKYHMIQGVFGANFYFTKKVQIRFDGNLIFTKNDKNDGYVTNESFVTLALQAKF